MQSENIYQNIAERTQGAVYLGIVGPVRTGKSTFIKRFMDSLVIPNIDNDYKRERAIDELPQSAQGRTIMTTEPKFVPNEAVEISLDDNASFKVRMIDCVGYVVPNAIGYIEDDIPRMVSTPWFDYEIPFEKAAEIGTNKVICDHSTIGIVVTTDGTVTELEREDYVEAETRVINELKNINKPFIILLNTTRPASESAENLKKSLEEQHGVPVIAVNCAELDVRDINDIMTKVLYEFPLTEITVNLPCWMNSLENDNPLKSEMLSLITDSIKDAYKISDISSVAGIMEENDNVKKTTVDNISLGEGTAEITIYVEDSLFYDVLSETSGLEIENDEQLMNLMQEVGEMKKEYEKIAPALKMAKETGYGIVSPSMEEMSLEEPEIVKQGNKYGVCLRASAPSIHLIRANIETMVSPIVGTERQSEELIHYLLNEFDDDPVKIWESNIFGKSLNELVNEGLHNKLDKMPEDAREKFRETLERIINEGNGGLICIIL